MTIDTLTAPRTSSMVGRVAQALHAYPYTALVLALGLLLRAILVPLTHGQDFVVWDLASRYTLAGVDIYAHHPHGYPGGPYTYPPLFLYSELPFQWLALHTGAAFTVLGKLVIVAGDVLTAILLAEMLGRCGLDDRLVALGAALYFLNPLVLYNGAFYGRFDAFPVALFLLAVRLHNARRRWVFPVAYALAVAAKTYPIFILPWLLMRDRTRRGRTIVGLVVVLGGLSLPYLVDNPRTFIHDTIQYNGGKLPGNLSWQYVLLGPLGPHRALLLSYALLALFAVALFLFARLDLLTYCIVAILSFLLFSKVVIEQYYLWPMPFLILDAIARRGRASAALFALLSATGFFVNPYIHPFGQKPPVITVAVALCILAYVLTRRPQSDDLVAT